MVHLLLAIIYLAFIGLGLPDSLLGAAWPSIYPQFQVPVSYMGILSMIISIGTILSSLNSDRLTKQFGAGLVTALSVGMTAIAILGFSAGTSFWMLCFLRIGCRKRRCRLKQLCRTPLCEQAYELAPLYVGCRYDHRPLRNQLRTHHRFWLALGI